MIVEEAIGFCWWLFYWAGELGEGDEAMGSLSGRDCDGDGNRVRAAGGAGAVAEFGDSGGVCFGDYFVAV
jgi:hypothetical protein